MYIYVIFQPRLFSQRVLGASDPIHFDETAQCAQCCGRRLAFGPRLKKNDLRAAEQALGLD